MLNNMTVNCQIFAANQLSVKIFSKMVTNRPFECTYHTPLKTIYL